MNSSGANTCNANNEHGDIGQYCPNAIPSAVRPYWSHFVSLVDSLDKLIEADRRTDGQTYGGHENNPSVEEGKD